MRGEDLAKQAVAIIKKTVVGKTGKIAPTIAKPTKKNPAIFKKSNLTLFWLDSESGHCAIDVSGLILDTTLALPPWDAFGVTL